MSSIRGGTSPPWRSVMAAAAPRIALVFSRKKPVGLISASTSAGSARARSAGSGQRLKSLGVTELTVRSVDWALRMVAIRSW
jgi:hypothetical protein